MALIKPSHIIFDMDGLLLNTEDLYTIGFQNVIGRFGKTYTWELKCSIMGCHGHEYSKKIVEELDLPMTSDEFLEETKAELAKLFPLAEFMPGAERLLKHLKAHNIPMALATSSSYESYAIKTARHKEIFDLFDSKTYGTSDPEVKRGKPSPDIFLVARDKFKDKPKSEKCLVFEDAINGVEAALAAGMQVVMVPDKRMDRELTKRATYVIDSLEEFRPEIWGLPAFDS